MPLTPFAESAVSNPAFGEASVSNPALAEFTPTAAIPALYPSAATYPSAAGTYPSAGTPATGLALSGATEGALTITPLPEESH